MDAGRDELDFVHSRNRNRQCLKTIFSNIEEHPRLNPFEHLTILTDGDVEFVVVRAAEEKIKILLKILENVLFVKFLSRRLCARVTKKSST